MMFAVILLLCLGLVTSYGGIPPYDLPGVPPSSRRIINGVVCENTAAFALTGALEIAYQKLTGNVPVKLSEQEIVDCYYTGCREADIEKLAAWARVQQRLAPADKYVPNRGGAKGDGDICRASHAPNALEVELSGIKRIESYEVEEWLEKSGFVFAGFNNDVNKCPGFYKRKSVYFTQQDKHMAKYRDGDGDGYIDGYERWFTDDEHGHVVTGEDTVYKRQYVLIVGIYDEQYYIVRDSQGDKWMRRGHFLIPRFNNDCGIEANLLAAEISTIEDKGSYDASTGCPVAFPKYCGTTLTCTKADQECVANENPYIKDYDPETDAPANKNVVWDFDGRAECEDKPGFADTCKITALIWKMCMDKKIKEICAGSCLVCARKTCSDIENVDCKEIERFCRINGVRAACAHTCQLHPNDCGSLDHNIDLLTGVRKAPQGTCYPPMIENGSVRNVEGLRTGEKLDIECDSGYKLSGADNYCVIQDLYGPDSRIIQTCVLEEDQKGWTGTGTDYVGQKAQTLMFQECANWRLVVAKGLFSDLPVEAGRAVMQDPGYNNNYCRNPGGAFLAPACLTSTINMEMFGDMNVVVEGGKLPEDGILTVELAELAYCELLPRCGGDHCANSVDVNPGWCTAEEGTDLNKHCSLEYVDSRRMHQDCQQFCCYAALECPETPGGVRDLFKVWDLDDFFLEDGTATTGTASTSSYATTTQADTDIGGLSTDDNGTDDNATDDYAATTPAFTDIGGLSTDDSATDDNATDDYATTTRPTDETTESSFEGDTWDDSDASDSSWPGL